MPEISRPPFGKSCLIMGLVCHIAAVMVAMMPVAGSELFFAIIFPISCFAFVAGAYRAFKSKNRHPLKKPQFWIIAAVTVIPLIGPLILWGMLPGDGYTRPDEPNQPQNRLQKIFHFKVNAWVLVLLLLVLFLFFAFIHSRNDPYFKKRSDNIVLQH